MARLLLELHDLPEFTAIQHFEYHDCLGSTNDRVKELFNQPGLPELPCLVIARRQTAGRGRGGKSWWSPDGALLMSLGFDLGALGLDREELPLLSSAVTLSVLEAVRERIPTEHPAEHPEEHKVGIHRPNDVYVDGKKISGILLESPTPQRVVVGVGLNVNNRLGNIPPELRERSITSLIELTGEKTDQAMLVRRILLHLHDMIVLIGEDRDRFIAEVDRQVMKTEPGV